MQILDGKKLSEKLKGEIVKRSSTLREKGISPKLRVFLIGEDEASQIYVKNKKLYCESVGIDCEIVELSKTTSEGDLLNKIRETNSDKSIHGMIVQLPIPKGISVEKVIDAIDPKKDVDGFTKVNLGACFSECKKSLLPATPAGVMKILDEYKIDVKGKNCVIIGHSSIVGKPLSALLLSRNATVSICHIFTKDLSFYTKNADLIFSATGKAKLIKKDLVKDNFIGIDIGISRDKNGKICGDFDFEELKEKASYLTPVPGGVGPMTIACLCENLIKTTENQAN